MITQNIIDEVTRRLVEVYKPVTIYLFGSYAWGLPTEESDLDLAIVVHNAEVRRIDRVYKGLKVLYNLGIAKDIIVYTKEEFDKAREHPSSLARKIRRQGKVLYGEA